MSFAETNPVREKFNEAMGAFQKRDFSESIRLFEETLKMYPDFAQVYNFMAMAKKEIGQDMKEVVALLEKSVELDPNYALAHDNLGKMYYGEGRFQEAKTHAKRAIELDPDLITAKLSLAWICLLGLGETGEAIDYFEEAIAVQKTEYGLFGLGMAYFMDHQRGKVLDIVTQLKTNGNDQLAKDLEDMIRQGRYLPPQGMQSLIDPRVANPQEMKEEAQAPIPNINYPVRLMGRLDQPSPDAINTASTATLTQNNEERIRQLRRNYQPTTPPY